MILFFISLILALVLGFGLAGVKFLFDGRSKRRIYKILAVADVTVVAGIAGGFFFRKYIPEQFTEYLGAAVTVFFMTQIICGVLVLMSLAVRTIYRKYQKPAAFSPERRRVLAYGIFYPIFSVVIALYGNRIERLETVDKFFDVPIKNLPDELEGFTIAQISDVHLGAYYSLDKLKILLQRIADAKPDLLAITGDIFDSVQMNPQAIKTVDEFTEKFKHGIYYCHGNHEHHRGIKAITEMLEKTKIHCLVNASENVTSKLYVLGVDYPSSSPVMSSGSRGDLDKIFEEQKREFVESALTGVPYDAVCVLLAHHPEFIDDGAEKNIALTLTGHTHGGQIGFFGLPLLPLFKYTRGIVKNGDSVGYVHVGNGSWFPFRLGCPPEIAYFTLKKKS